MPTFVEYGNHVFVKGIGIDNIIRDNDRIIFIDNDYADMYGDYIFMGYDVFLIDVSEEYIDIVGLNTAMTLMNPVDEDTRRRIVVCGERKAQCAILLALTMALQEGKDLETTLPEALCLTGRIYETPIKYIPFLLLEAADTYLGLIRLYGDTTIKLIFSLASNYGYGLGERFYSELVSWLYQLKANREAIDAGLFSFLAESSYGLPREILNLRLEALKIEELERVFGEHALKAIDVLRDYANSKLYRRPAAEYTYVRRLGPGEGYLLAAKRSKESTTLLYCSRDELGAPSRKCVERVRRAVDIAESTGLEWLAKPHVRVLEKMVELKAEC